MTILSHLESPIPVIKHQACRTAYVEGFEVEEIARISGLTVETVRTNILRKQ
jgi:DNA-directed RNA polymerase specialized sigma24 family protein